ncbi:MAG TPA: FtsX-like permease family protein [Anaeromyxobacteraceae bacterium]|nr:FtsX-like permease family protein [Anaeromyxobacteraceae bacterium]
MLPATGKVKVLFRIALRNLAAGRARTAIIGTILLVGTLLVVVGSSLVESVDRGMRSSIQGSLGGQLQVYDARSKDELALYGGMGREPLLEPIVDFSRVKAELEKVPNVKRVIPMGIDQALVATGNQIDVALERLRADVRRLEAGEDDPELRRRYQAHQAHVRRMVTLLRDDLKSARALADDELLRERKRDGDDLARAASDDFWAGFERDRLAGLEFLENRIAPQGMEGGMTYVRYVGTDLDAFMEAFDRAHVVEGERVPSGHRGILLGKWYAEEYLKIKNARRLDKIKDARDFQRRRIATDEELRRWVKENTNQLSEIQMQLDPLQAEEAAARLRRGLGSAERDLSRLLVELFSTTDADFEKKYRLFYDELAPLLQLYKIRIGDTITIKAPSRSGYYSSVNVKVYGFVEFRGLEKSRLAGVMSLLDLMTWRDLYGYLTKEKAEEVRALRDQVGARQVPRESAEAELFGGGGPAVEKQRAGRIDEAALLAGIARPARTQDLAAQAYSQEEIDRGVALNAALILRDPSRIRATMEDVERASRRAGLGLKVVDWQKASGLVGQSVTMFRIVLYTAVLIIFAVALVIINNAMVMATLQRVREIGTMRAIGAQRRFVTAMLLVETAAVSLLFGVLGAVLGAAALWAVRAWGGIPATNDQLYFFFSGPALLPALGTTGVAVSLGLVLVVSMLSGFYPAIIAMKVTPVEAMAADD